MGLGFSFGGKGFRVRVSSRGISTSFGKNGLRYTTYHSFKGKKRKHKKQNVKPTVIKETKPQVTLQERMDATNAKLNEIAMATKAEKERQESDLGLMKFCSFFMKFIGVIMVLLGLVLMVVPPVGLVVIGLGVVFFIKGNNYSKRVKILKTEELKKQVK